MLKRPIQVMLLALATLGCAAPGPAGGGSHPEIAIDRGADGSTVTLREGQGLSVTLAGNPTTGFVWELVPGAEAVLARQGEARFTPESAKLGAGGAYRFAFRAVAPGKAPLKFVLHRPFEVGKAPAGTFQVTVVVARGDAE